MTNTLPKVPVRFIAENSEMLDSMAKSHTAGQTLGGTDYTPEQAAAYHTAMHPEYRTAPDRVNGNVIFRRYADGSLDVDYAKNQIVEAIRKVRDNIPLNSMEEAALSSCFPNVFSHYIDSGVVSSVRAVSCKISLLESQAVSAAVAAHLAAELDWKHSCHAR